MLEPSLGKRYTVVSVDLPFHGQTRWDKEEKFSHEAAWQFVEALMLEHSVRKVSLAAFSIGGKIALKLFATKPEKIESLLLLAPDGLQNNMWYNIAVYPKWGRALFRFLLDRPKLVVGVVRLLKRIGVFPKYFARFLETSLKKSDERERVWDTWLGIAGFEVPQKRLRETLIKSDVSCLIIMGEHDAVIKPRVGKQFVRNVPNATLTIIPKGHYLLKPYLNDYIERILSK